MSETPHLAAALVKLQADLPRIGKEETAKVPGKDGKQGYSYKYADLADVSQAVLPLLASLGLAFTAKPTVIDGEFGLAYKLVHESGESDEGFYLLPNPKTTAAQQVGSAITYARRYSLLAITGVAPDGDDDDAAAAQGGFGSSAGDAFENAAPASPRPQDSGRRGDGERRPPAEDAAEWVRSFTGRVGGSETSDDLRARKIELAKAVQAKLITPQDANELTDIIKRRDGEIRSGA